MSNQFFIDDIISYKNKKAKKKEALLYTYNTPATEDKKHLIQYLVVIFIMDDEEVLNFVLNK